jgi:LEA14-like dessication related protein
MIWFLLSLFLVLILAAAAAGAAIAYRSAPPDVTLAGLRPERFSTTGQTLGVKLRVQNPAPLPLPIRAITYRVWLDAYEIANGDGSLARWVPARGEATIELQVSGDAKRLARALPALALKRQPWSYRLAGTLTPLPPLRIGYDHCGTIDARGILKLAASLRPTSS